MFDERVEKQARSLPIEGEYQLTKLNMEIQRVLEWNADFDEIFAMM